MGLRHRAEEIIAKGKRQRFEHQRMLASECNALVEPRMDEWSAEMGLTDVPRFTVTDRWSVHENGDGEDVTSINFTFDEGGINFLGKLVVTDNTVRSFDVTIAGSSARIRNLQDLARALIDVEGSEPKL